MVLAISFIFSKQLRLEESNVVRQNMYPSIADELTPQSPVVASSFDASWRRSQFTPAKNTGTVRRGGKNKSKGRYLRSLMEGTWRSTSRFLLHRGRRTSVTVRGLDDAHARATAFPPSGVLINTPA